MISSDIIAQVCGPFGRWQLRTILIIFLVKIPSCWFMACIIFTAPVPQNGEVFCRRPEYLKLNSSEWIQLSHPIKKLNDKDYKVDVCHIYKDVLSLYNIHDDSSDNPLNVTIYNRSRKLARCEAFEHETNYISVITQFDLVCSREILAGVTQFFHLFGVLWGGIIATYMMKS